MKEGSIFFFIYIYIPKILNRHVTKIMFKKSLFTKKEENKNSLFHNLRLKINTLPSGLPGLLHDANIIIIIY